MSPLPWIVVQGKASLPPGACDEACAVGVRESDRRESLPWQKVFADEPNEPVVNTPDVVVITGRFAVEPIAPAFVMLPCECEAAAAQL